MRKSIPDCYALCRIERQKSLNKVQKLFVDEICRWNDLLKVHNKSLERHGVENGLHIHLMDVSPEHLSCFAVKLSVLASQVLHLP